MKTTSQITQESFEAISSISNNVEFLKGFPVSVPAVKVIEYKSHLTSHTIKLLENIVERLTKEMLKLKEKNCWTMDATKIRHLPGDAKCYNQAKQETITYLQEEIKKLKV